MIFDVYNDIKGAGRNKSCVSRQYFIWTEDITTEVNA